MKVLRCMLAGGLLSSAATATPLDAAEIRVLSAAVMQTVFKEVAADFERSSGHRVTFVYATMGAITERMLSGERADLVIGSTPSIARLVKEKKIEDGTAAAIARVGVGAVVPSGTAVPSLRNGEDLARALAAARVVVYANPAGGGAAGIHVAKVIENLGLREALAGKTVLGAGGDVTEVTLAQGQGAFGLTQISEIVGKPGADFAGPLPQALQNYTGVSVGVPPGGAQREAVRAFVEFLKGPAAAAAMRSRGMDPV